MVWVVAPRYREQLPLARTSTGTHPTDAACMRECMCVGWEMCRRYKLPGEGTYLDTAAVCKLFTENRVGDHAFQIPLVSPLGHIEQSIGMLPRCYSVTLATRMIGDSARIVNIFM